jgi:hypothetical protein
MYAAFRFAIKKAVGIFCVYVRVQYTLYMEIIMNVQCTDLNLTLEDGRIAHSCTVRFGGGRAKELHIYIDRGRRERGFSLSMCAPLPPSPPSPPPPFQSLNTASTNGTLSSLVHGRGKARGYSMLYSGTGLLVVV